MSFFFFFFKIHYLFEGRVREREISSKHYFTPDKALVSRLDQIKSSQELLLDPSCGGRGPSIGLPSAAFLGAVIRELD